jgi:hypothetical protein
MTNATWIDKRLAYRAGLSPVRQLMVDGAIIGGIALFCAYRFPADRSVCWIVPAAILAVIHLGNLVPTWRESKKVAPIVALVAGAAIAFASTSSPSSDSPTASPCVQPSSGWHHPTGRHRPSGWHHSSGWHHPMPGIRHRCVETGPAVGRRTLGAGPLSSAALRRAGEVSGPPRCLNNS